MYARRVAVAVTLFASAITINVSSAPAPASAHDAEHALSNAITHNLCGGSKAPCGNDGDLTPAQNLFQYVINQSPTLPMSIATQETCRDPYNFLKGWLAISGYHAERTNDPIINSVCAQHGNAVFFTGGCYNNNCKLTDEFTNQDADGNRRWVCAIANAPRYATCSAHMSTESGIAFLQVGQYKQIADWFNTSPTIAAGDFNLHPQFVPAFYDSYWEADADQLQVLPNRPTWRQWGGTATQKIDYVFHDVYRFHTSRITDSPESDHHRVRAYLSFTP